MEALHPADPLEPDAQTRAPADAPTREVYTGLRVIRTLAMLSIVAYHVEWKPDREPDPVFGVSFGLNTLQVIMCALIARHAVAPRLGKFTAKRARRLLVPWVFWSLAYIVVEVLLSVRYGHTWWAPLHLSMIYTGGSFHLWFLLYGFAASLLVLCCLRACEGDRARVAIPLAAGLGSVLVLFGTTLNVALTPPDPFQLWLDGSAAVAFGLALGRALSLPGARERLGWMALISALAVLPLLVGPDLAPRSQLWSRYAIAVPLACAGFLVRVPESRLLVFLASCNLGIYVVHMLSLRLVDRLPWLDQASEPARIGAVYGISLLAVGLLQRTRLRSIA